MRRGIRGDTAACGSDEAGDESARGNYRLSVRRST